jgi:AcrR family transcriptional regulator
VRRAVLDAATTLFAQRGVDAVSLRDIAAAADVHVSLIIRYIGHREELVAEVFGHVSDQLARAVEENPL